MFFLINFDIIPNNNYHEQDGDYVDYIGEKCPVCNKNFHADDDIVVCPLCGTPHHRECYENIGHCVNESKHNQGFTYENSNSNSQETNSDFIICKKCGRQNPKGTFFCNGCGEPLNEKAQKVSYGANGQNNPFGQQPGDFGGMPPFGMPPMGAVTLDPLGGMNPEEVIDNGVTVGETAKYVKANSLYFLNVFKRIKGTGKSKFSFAGFLFSGGYLLYRKMYKIGAVICSLNFLLILASTLINYSDMYINIFNQLADMSGVAATSQYNTFLMAQNALRLPVDQLLIFLAPTFLSLINLIINIIVGFNANKLYYKHCIKNISKIKKECNSADEANAKLQTSGGVNTPIAFSLLAVLFVINLIPYIMLL